MKLYSCLSILLILISSQTLCMNTLPRYVTFSTWMEFRKQVIEMHNPRLTDELLHIPMTDVDDFENDIEGDEIRLLDYTKSIYLDPAFQQNAKNCETQEEARDYLEKLYLIKRFESKLKANDKSEFSISDIQC